MSTHPFTPRIYLASSWKNQRYPTVLAALRRHGFDVYDFRDEGFDWREVGLGDPSTWDLHTYYRALASREAHAGYSRDISALDRCDACVLVLPAGRSAHLELGYACARARGFVLFDTEAEPLQPDLMYLSTSGRTDSVLELIDMLSAMVRDPR